MVVAMLTADVGFPNRPRRQYTTTDIARHQDILMAANYILNICVRGEKLSGWVSTGVYCFVQRSDFCFLHFQLSSLAEPLYRVGW